MCGARSVFVAAIGIAGCAPPVAYSAAGVVAERVRDGSYTARLELVVSSHGDDTTTTQVVRARATLRLDLEAGTATLRRERNGEAVHMSMTTRSEHPFDRWVESLDETLVMRGTYEEVDDMMAMVLRSAEGEEWRLRCVELVGRSAETIPSPLLACGIAGDDTRGYSVIDHRFPGIQLFLSRRPGLVVRWPRGTRRDLRVELSYEDDR
jgi:hypothetical protein